MSRLERMPGLDREIRQDDLSELGTPTWDLVREAIARGDSEEALRMLDYGATVDQGLLDSLISYLDDMLTFLCNELGEEEAFEVVRRRYLPRVRDFLARTPEPLQAMQREVENQRGHYADVEVSEDDEKYVVTLQECGTGGRLRRTKEVARTKEAHSWSWGKKDIPYYCAHCSLMWEIIPIEERGHPIAVFLPPERDEDACRHLYYKRPEDVPEEYYARVGKVKPAPAGSGGALDGVEDGGTVQG